MTGATVSRSPALDGLRVVSILGVVSIHVGAWAIQYPHSPFASLLGPLSAGAVPTFFIVSGYLWSSGRAQTQPLRRIFFRLLVPYAVWSTLYLGLGLVTGLLEAVSWRWGLAVVFFGHASWHLWFLPALAGCHVVALWANTPKRRVAAALLGLPALIVKASGIDYPLAAALIVNWSTFGWLFVFFLGVWLSERRVCRVSPWLVRAATLVYVLLVTYSTVCGPFWARGGVRVAGMIGLSYVLVYDAAGGGDGLKLSRLGSLAPFVLGIYLVHMIPIDLLRVAWTPPQPVSAVVCLAVLLVVAVTSFGLTAGIRRFAFGRVVVGEYRPAVAALQGASEAVGLGE